EGSVTLLIAGIKQFISTSQQTRVGAALVAALAVNLIRREPGPVRLQVHGQPVHHFGHGSRRTVRRYKQRFRLLSFTGLINQMGQHAGTVVSVDAIGKGCRQHGTPLAYLFNQPGSAGTIDAAETEDTVWKAAGTNQRFGFQQAFAAEARRLRWRVFIYPAAILLPVDTG